MEAKIEQNGIQRVQVEHKVEHKAIQNSDKKMTARGGGGAATACAPQLGAMVAA